MTLRTPLTIPLTSVSTRLRFWTRWFTEASFDYGQVRYSSDRGVTWIPLRGKWTSYSAGEGYSGWEPTWVRRILTFRFSLARKSSSGLRSPDGSTVQDGWYVDDIAVRSYEATTGRLGEMKPLVFPSVAVAESDTLELTLRNIGVAPVVIRPSRQHSRPFRSSLLRRSHLDSGDAGFGGCAGDLQSRPTWSLVGTLAIASDDPFKPVCSLPVLASGSCWYGQRRDALCRVHVSGQLTLHTRSGNR